MSAELSSATQPIDAAPTGRGSAHAHDVSGRSRLAWNVLTGWGSYLVYIVAGFVLPRCIDDRLGQLALGVWDFGWSIVSYFALAQVGIGSSGNRFIASYRAHGDTEGVRRTASTLAAILLGIACLVAVLAVASSAVVGWLAAGRVDPSLLEATRWVVLLLGLELAVQQATIVFNVVLTGCHRWDLHNAIASGAYALTVIAMVVSLLLGGGLFSLALITLLGTVAAQIARAIVCFRVCPELRFSFGYIRAASARELMASGGKVFVARIADLLMEQTVSVLIAAQLGLGALAVFSRPRALFRHVGSLVGKLALVLEPTAGSLQAVGQRRELQDLLIRTSRAGALLALPATIVLVLLGDPILTIWMGPDYAVGWVAPVLAVGSLASLAQLPVMSILVGLNVHGRVGVAKLIAAAVSVAVAYLTMSYLNLGLMGAALAVTLPAIAIGGVYVPHRACRELGMSRLQYLKSAWVRPLLCQAPLALCLLLGRLLVKDWTLPVLLAWLGASGGLLVVTYWSLALPDTIRQRIVARARAALGLRSRVRAEA